MAKVITRFRSVGGMLVTVDVVPEKGDSERVKTASEHLAGITKEFLEESAEEIHRLKEVNVNGQPH